MLYSVSIYDSAKYKQECDLKNILYLFHASRMINNIKKILPCKSCGGGMCFPPWHPQWQPGDNHEGNSDHFSWQDVSRVGWSALVLRDVHGSLHDQKKG